jgi:cell fate regulator YaaT (PSP1 superfamily)
VYYANGRAKKTNDFERLAKALIAVFKSEIDRREAEYQKERKSAKKRKVA